MSENDDLYELRASVLKALASPIRLKIVDVLAEGDLRVADIVERVGAERSNISRHLSVLVGAHILEARKEGLNVIYSLRCRCVLRFFACAEDVIREQIDTRTKRLAEIEGRLPRRGGRRARGARKEADSRPR